MHCYYKTNKLQHSKMICLRIKYPVCPTIHMTDTNASNWLPANSVQVSYYNYTLFFFFLRCFLLCHLKTKPHQSSVWSCSCSSSVFICSSFFLWHFSGSFILKTFQRIKSLSSPNTSVLIYWAAQIIFIYFDLVYLCYFYDLQALYKNIFQTIKHRWKCSYLSNHLPTCLITFTVVCLLLQLLQYTFSCCAVLQWELWHNATKFIWLCICHTMQWDSQPQQELVEPAHIHQIHLN